MFRPSELQSFLESIGASPKKSLSQNFLIDNNILKKIIAVSDLKPGDLVLEIGPGPGALTQSLLEAGARVIAVEKDTLFARHLTRFEGVTVLEQDIKNFDFDIIRNTGQRAKIIANLPYHLTSVILGQFAPHAELFQKMVVMVQHEVALRMTAKAGSPDYSSLTVFLNYYGKPKYEFTVSRKSFFPAPKVDSAIVSIDLISKTPSPTLLPLIRKAFQQKRKMISSSLQEYGKERVKAALESLHIDPQARPAALMVEEWVALHQILEELP